MKITPIRFSSRLEEKFRGWSPLIAIIKTGQFPVLSKFSALGERPFDVSSAINFTRAGGPPFISDIFIQSENLAWNKSINYGFRSSLSLSLFFLSLKLSPASVYNWVCSCEHGLRKLNGTRAPRAIIRIAKFRTRKQTEKDIARLLFSEIDIYILQVWMHLMP